MSGTTIKLLQEFADYCAVNNKVISKNIANVGTQNYRSEKIVFKNLLNNNMIAKLRTTDDRQFGAVNQDSFPEYEIKEDQSRDNVSGVNNVDIDKQMASLAENTLNFKFASNRIKDYFDKIQMVIKGNV